MKFAVYISRRLHDIVLPGHSKGRIRQSLAEYDIYAWVLMRGKK